MAVDASTLQDDFFARIDLACSEMDRWKDTWETLGIKIARSRTSWLVAQPGGPMTEACPKPDRPKELTVIAADGVSDIPRPARSRQLFSDQYWLCRHSLRHGRTPGVKQRTNVFFTMKTISIRNGRASAVQLPAKSLACGAMRWNSNRSSPFLLRRHAEGRTCVGLTDGTLILWMLEGKPYDFRRETLQTTLMGLERLRELRVPIAGYISDPRQRRCAQCSARGPLSRTASQLRQVPVESSRGAASSRSRWRVRTACAHSLRTHCRRYRRYAVCPQTQTRRAQWRLSQRV